MTIARRTPSGWLVDSPCPVGDVATLLARLSAGGGTVALGVDFPIGLPRDYAALHVTDPSFPAFLRGLGARPGFLSVCATLDEIGGDRPFYPARGAKGMTRLSHARALGLASAAGLSRQCDRATTLRPAGAPVFWTLGANQSGKAAICAWRDLLHPALAAPHPPALWPFDGPFLSLLAPGRVAIAETYPAEALRQLGLRVPGSKRRQADRAALAAPLGAALATLATVTPALQAALAAGFGADAAGEDRFDSVLGLTCVLRVVQGVQTDRAPNDPAILTWEGWVLGQAACPPRDAPS